MSINISRTISAEEMYTGVDFCFGTNFSHPTIKHYWNPDGDDTQNPHLMIIGGSGSGKTRLLVHIIEYLHLINKQVYIIDFHGDIKTKHETHYIFKSRNSEYGISFFNFSKDVDNGGPAAQASILTAIFRKIITTRMGDIQKTVLKQFLIDCYRYVGILDEDESTWDNNIPTLETMTELYSIIINNIESGSGFSIVQEFAKLEKLKKKYEESNNEKQYEKLVKNLDELGLLYDRYRKYILNNEYKEVFDVGLYKNIDMKFYMESSNLNALKSLSPYLHELKSGAVFNDNKPPKAQGIVRYDISGFTNIEKPTEAMFFADITIQEIFRNIKMLGEYKNRSEEYRLRRGKKCDKFIVIDESKLVLPTGSDKENPFNILNRIVSEARKFGLGLIMIYTKVILNMGDNDIAKSKNILGIKNDLLFRHQKESADGVAIIGHTGGVYNSVATPWFKPKKH